MNFFDEMAGVWNKTCRYDTGRIEKVLSVLQLKQGDTVLDIGTGTGVMIPFIREQVGHYAPIVAVDSSEKMLREASLRFPNAGVRFVRADVFGWTFQCYFAVFGVPSFSLSGRYDCPLGNR